MSDVVLAHWHRRPWAGWALRLGGLLFLLAAWQVGALLIRRGEVVRTDAVDYALALIAFLGASVGMFATWLGAHLFDQMPIASRWGQTTIFDLAEAEKVPLAETTILWCHPSTDSRSLDRSRSAMA